ncbi:KAP family NTPase [Xanthomonas prunicola]|nr:P-loop NTPase fold protein [Xanthomonas prunicola]USJ01060.1 KAP family NTPase [Xanthomonas prunicola]
MKQLDLYLQGPQPGYAMLIGGSWGVGKSFVWQRYARQLEEITPITISAAGLQTAEDLERALFQASISDLGPKPMIELGSVVGRALLRVVKVDPNDIKLKADVTGGRSVICIDDIERFAGDFNVIFGFVVNLIDVNGVHCVLIADEERANERFKNEYGKYKERIVGKTIVLQPNIHDFCDQVIKGFANQQVREAMLAGAERLVALIEGAKLRNLRAVRFF